MEIQKKMKPVVYLMLKRGLMVTFLVFFIVTAYVFLKPTETVVSEIERVNRMEIDYHYDVYPQESILYEDENEPIYPQKDFYHSNIINWVELEISAFVDWDGATWESPEEIVDVTAFLSSEHWRKDLSVNTDFSVDREDQNSFQTVITLPLEEAAALSQEIMDEIRQRGARDYNLVVQTTLDLNKGETQNPNKILSRSAMFQFTAGGMLVEIQEEGSHLEELETERIHKNHISLMGISLGIGTARNVFLPITIIVFFFGSILLVNEYQIRQKNVDQAETRIDKILRKNRNRIIESKSIKETVLSNERIPSIPLMSFEDLNKIAEEIEKPIIMERNRLKEATFYVIDQDTVYYYQLV